MVNGFTVLDLLDSDLKEHDSLNLTCLGGRKGLGRKICNSELNRPGLALTGFFDSFASRRIQVFGHGESAYLVKLALEEKTSAIKRMFEETIPCCIFTHALTPTSFFFEEAERKHCPILQTSLSTADFVSRLIRILTNVFSPRQGFDGVLMEVYGLGVLIQGLPGVGKSESALELIKRGHRLVADDIVKIHCINGNTLLGTGVNKIIGHFMEIRGLGIIDIFQLFGIGAVLDQVQVQLVIQLEKWDPNKKYDRLGLNEKFQQYFGVSIPELEIPVGPERNIPSIVETAAMNERLKKAGHDTVRDLRQNIMKWQEKGSASPFYEDIG